mmetsp:Transcript_42855/g.103630  ORF Transcript_42855/g.103630 Transcript_42855/m.103630 type:complete len:434 (-) Transcript_42855:28-1329(-)
MATVSPLARFLLRLLLNIYRWCALWYFRARSYLSSKPKASDALQSEAERRIENGQAWDEFCDTLKAAGATVFAPGAPRDPFNQAEGYRYLSRLTRAGLENFVECADVEAPKLCAIANGSRAARVCIGSDNPDNLYENSTVDSSLEYTVVGTRGTVPYLSFGTQAGSYGSKGGLQTVDLIEARNLEYEEDGSFIIILSAERPSHAKNWLRLEPNPREALFIVRQTFGDRSKETPAKLSIRCTTSSALSGSFGKPSPLTAEKLDRGLQQASVFVAGASAMFAKWSHEFKSNHANTLPLFDPIRSTKAGGDPNIRYYHSYWDLKAKGTVLRIRFTPPPCLSWNFQLNNHWMESLDYRYHTIHTNSTLAQKDNNDKNAAYTIIVSEKDPNWHGVFRGNWIETTGHDCGTMCFRWVGPKVKDSDLPQPRVEVLAFEDL